MKGELKLENNQLHEIRCLCRQLDAIEEIIQQIESDKSYHQLKEYTKARETTLQLLLSAINEKSIM